ncbi:M23 family metallopeptidase [Occultella glacieicola]|uniref:M23 family metallopeptidase n=1 Tax=Occultella glacieicola TaxID=2518684 RepID=UPI00140505F3|nr:M23 family metallopeptidase [Occultella glacieicola]
MPRSAVRHARRALTDRGSARRATLLLVSCESVVGACVLVLALAGLGLLQRGPSWSTPTSGELSSAFGPRADPFTGVPGLHAGQDIRNDCGTAVFAAADGVVRYAAPGPYQGRTGNQIVIDHSGGISTRYGHVLTGTMVVEAGDRVTAGSQIAQMGGDQDLDPIGAGNSTGCHLHFEVNIDDEPVDPLAYLLTLGVTIAAEP